MKTIFARKLLRLLMPLLAAVFALTALTATVAHAEEKLLRLRTFVQVGNDVIARPFLVVKNGTQASVKISSPTGTPVPRDVALSLQPTIGKGDMVSIEAALKITPVGKDGKADDAAVREEKATLKIALGQTGSYTWPAAKGAAPIKLQVSVDPATSAQVEAMRGLK
jgi:hypothetical protein